MGHAEGLERMLERALDQRDEREAENKRLLDQLKRTQTYEASMLGDMERLKTVLAARLARIEKLEKESTQRGARMQLMRDWMEELDDSLWINAWERFLGEHPNTNYQDWFDENGVPVREIE